MNKVAKRLIIIALIGAMGVVFFLNKVMNSPSTLSRLLPANTNALIHFNTREVAKDVYRYGGFNLDSMKYLSDKFPYFKLVEDPRAIGINLYSEIFLFENIINYQTYQGLLFNLINHNNFVHFCKNNSLLKEVELEEGSAIFHSKRDSFYLVVEDKEAMVFFGLYSKSEAKNLRRDMLTQQEHNTFKDLLDKKANIAIFQKDSSELLQKHFPFLQKDAKLFGNFKPGSFIFTGNTSDTIGYSEMNLPFSLDFTSKENAYTFKKEIKTPNKEQHPLSYIFKLWQ